MSIKDSFGVQKEEYGTSVTGPGGTGGSPAHKAPIDTVIAPKK